MPGIAGRFAALLTAIVCVLPSTSMADEEASRYFAELRRRHLFRVAEAYCLHQLERSSLDNETRADLTLELSRTFIEHARNAPRAEQGDLWQRAAQLLDDALAREIGERLQFKLERALV